MTDWSAAFPDGAGQTTARRVSPETRERLEGARKALEGYLSREPSAADRLKAERHRRKEERRASGRPAPVDYLRKAMDLYEARGYAVERTERFDAALNRRFDLFGCVDAVAVGPQGTVAIQATSWANVASRVTKMGQSKMLKSALAAGWTAVVVGFRKGADGRWEHREVEIFALTDL